MKLPAPTGTSEKAPFEKRKLMKQRILRGSVPTKGDDMTALNITTNDLTDPIRDPARVMDNDDIEKHGNVMSAKDVVKKTRRPRQQTGGTLVGYENVPSWPHEALLEPANDNEPRQLDLFYDYDNNGDAT